MQAPDVRLRVLLDQTDAGLAPGTAVGAGSQELARLYASPRGIPSARWVRTNMVSTLDGAATGADGRSGSINTGADKVVFDLLRAWSDGILVGAQTVRTEGYGPARTADEWLSMRAGRARHPTMVVVTGSGRLPETFLEEAAEGSDPAHAGTLEATPQGGAAEREAAGDVLVVTAGACPADRLADLRARLGRDRVLALAGERVDVAIALDALAERGLARVLAEGGPHLLADLVEADVVDEWCHTIVSRVVGGDAPRIVNTGGSVTLGLRLRPRLLLEAGGDLIGTWVRPTPHTAIGE
ncbi:MAG: dihydrofolate reductase family protein [Micrococcales bacterium]|nr:dihydrofolate reductase family protein [Micrococcales bacterium]